MSETTEQLETGSANSGSLSIGEKIGYGLGDTASNLYWKLFECFQLIFYTDVFGISAGAAGTMFFVTKIFDAVNDPIIGLMADRTRTAWGRFRPYLLWMSIPFALTGIATFYTPDLPPNQKLIYAYITYILVFVAYTAINIPYGALMGVISSDSIERTSVSTYRFVLAFMGGLVVQLFTQPIIRFFGGEKIIVVDGIETTEVLNPQAGFFWAVVCYACAAVVLFAICFWTTRERVQPRSDERTPLALDFKDLLRNGPWMIIFLFSMLQVVAAWTRGSATGYYFTYYVAADFGSVLWGFGGVLERIGISLGDFGTFFAAGTIASILGMLLAKPLVRVIGAKTLMAVLALVVAVSTAAFWVIREDQVALMYLVHILGAFAGGPIPVLMWAMFADIADYSEWKNDRRATGLVFAAATFSQKFGGAIGGAVPGWLLAWYGFVAPIEGAKQVQSDEAVSGIIAMMSVIPAAVILVSAVVILFYRLDKTFLEKIQRELLERKQQDA